MKRDRACQAISFLCRPANLIVAELWLRFGAGLKTSRPLAAAAQNPG